MTEEPSVQVKARPPRSESSDSIAIGAVIVAIFAFLAAIFAVVLANNAVDEARDGAGGSAEATASAGAGSETVDVALTEFLIDPSSIEATPGATLKVVNRGAIQHNLSVGGKSTTMLGTGGTEALDLAGLAPGTYELRCDVPGHATAGMIGTLVIT